MPKLLNGLYLFSQDDYLTESQVVKIKKNHLILFQSNHHYAKEVNSYYPFDGGLSWVNGTLHKDLPQPICQVAAISFTRYEKKVVAVLNPADKRKRRNTMLYSVFRLMKGKHLVKSS
ncbi:MAG: hypothetical protein BWX74_00575 [Tenericutes bacterium ADurb.Bin087]|jgi:hypothetical protein|nr:MAG: hypothetical protein BWX74_00575 [Tenericutes bacterium ADurb.Bin087]